MTITAKYPGTCATCGRRFSPGTSIEWARGQAPRHTSCQGSTSRATYPGGVQLCYVCHRRPSDGLDGGKCLECFDAF